MRGKTILIIGIMLASSLTSVFIVDNCSAEKKVIYVDANGDADYRYIQDAIDHANEGDTIYVYAGVYNENVYLNKNRLTLIGEEKTASIIDSSAGGVGVTITANKCSLESFTIRNTGSYGVYLNGVTDAVMRDCTIISSAMFGVYVKNSARCTMKSVSSHHNHRYGFYFVLSQNCTISSCSTYENDNQNYHDHGFMFNGVSTINITDCLSYNNYYGFYLDYSNNCTLTRCSTYGNAGYGIHLYDTDDCLMTDCLTHDNSGFGFFLELSDRCFIRNSICYRTNTGVMLYYAENNTVTNCTTYSNSWAGIQIRDESNDSIVTDCTIHHNWEGIMILESSGNLLYHNNLYQNLENGYDDGLNSWDNGYPSGGNYWGDYRGRDDDGDGIGDIPHLINGTGSIDYYPFILQNSWQNTAPLKPMQPSGPMRGRTDQSYSYITSTTDLDADQVYYLWDWGGEQSMWQGPYKPGEIVQASHKWSRPGIYHIRAKAKDSHDLQSSWSDSMVVVIWQFYDVERSAISD